MKKTPLEVDTTTILTGTAAKLDSSTNQLVENPVYLISRTYTDTDISDDDTNAWLSTTCIMVDRGQDPKVCVDGSDDMVTASASVFASDRVTAMVNELRRLGLAVDEHDDGLTGHPGPVSPATIEVYDDHRMAMSFAVAGLRVDGIRIADPECTAKTYPGFFNDLERLCETAR